VNFVDPSGLSDHDIGNFDAGNVYPPGLSGMSGAGLGGGLTDLVLDLGEPGGGFDPTNPDPSKQRDFPCPPSFQEFYKNKQIQEVFRQAFDAATSSGIEQGGWIFMDKRGRLLAVPKESEPADRWDRVHLGYPPEIAGMIIVATFHTHPENMGPDSHDEGVNRNRDRVPGIIIKSGEPQLVGYGPDRGLWRRDLPRGCK
jgi:hypothetical protein